MRLLLVIVVAALLGCGQPALAGAGPRTSESLAIAAAYWGQECGASVEWRRLPGQWGSAVIGGCGTDAAIWLNRRDRFGLSAWQWCHVVVHEYGHLVGHTHDSPLPIMAADGWPRLPACSAMKRRALN